jgi:hypothetical protein
MKNYGSVTDTALQSLGLRIGDGHLDNNREASDKSGGRPIMMMIMNFWLTTLVLTAETGQLALNSNLLRGLWLAVSISLSIHSSYGSRRGQTQLTGELENWKKFSMVNYDSQPEPCSILFVVLKQFSCLEHFNYLYHFWFDWLIFKLLAHTCTWYIF